MTRDRPADSPIRDVRWVGKFAVIQAAGEIDLNCSPRFQQELLALLDRRPERIVLDLADVSYMDSSGVASLVKLLSRVRRLGAQLHLVGLSDRVRSVFEITRLDSVFDIFATQEEAMA